MKESNDRHRLQLIIHMKVHRQV